MDEFGLEEDVKNIEKTIEAFKTCMVSDNANIPFITPLNLGDMLTKKKDMFIEEFENSADDNYFDFDIFDRFDKNGKEKLDEEQLRKVVEFQKMKYCLRSSGLEKL